MLGLHKSARVDTHKSESFALKPTASSLATASEASRGVPAPTADANDAAAAVDGEAEAGSPAAEDAADITPTMTEWQLRLTFFSLAVVGFLASLDTSIVATAMPTIASEFRSLNQQSWVALSYLLTATVFMPLFGRATDLFGCRSVLFATIFVFELGSLLCAVAQNFIWLCCARAIAGMGGAGIITVISVIVSQLVPIRERGKYLGLIIARMFFATILGPLIGGLFVSYNWRWCFWINLIIAVPALPVLLMFATKLPHTTKPDVSWHDIDFGGIVIMGTSIVSLCLAFNWGGVVYDWNSQIVIALLVVGSALVPLFVAWEMKVPSFPLIPMKMFRFRNVTTSFVTSFFTASALQGVFLYLPSYYQIVKHDTQVISGLEVLPFIMPLLLTSTLSGIIISRTGAVRGVLWLGTFTTMLGTGLLIMVNGHHPRAVEYVLLFITGLGGGFLIQGTTLSAQSQVTRELLATVTTMSMWSRSLGAIVGVAMQGSIITNLFKRGILASAAAAPYVAQLLAVDNVKSLPADVQSVAANSYGSAFGTMMIATTAFCAPGFIVSLVAKEKLS